MFISDLFQTSIMHMLAKFDPTPKRPLYARGIILHVCDHTLIIWTLINDSKQPSIRYSDPLQVSVFSY